MNWGKGVVNFPSTTPGSPQFINKHRAEFHFYIHLPDRSLPLSQGDPGITFHDGWVSAHLFFMASGDPETSFPQCLSSGAKTTATCPSGEHPLLPGNTVDSCSWQESTHPAEQASALPAGEKKALVGSDLWEPSCLKVDSMGFGVQRSHSPSGCQSFNKLVTLRSFCFL